MRINSRHGRLGLVMLLALVASAFLSGSVAAYEEVHLYGVLEARDVQSGKLVVDGREFVATERTRFFDEGGKRITLKDFEPFDVHRGLFSFDDATTVEISAAQLRGRWVVQWMKRTKGLPD